VSSRNRSKTAIIVLIGDLLGKEESTQYTEQSGFCDGQLLDPGKPIVAISQEKKLGPLLT
jgi:hypothetical protein